jgi:hypothetical protein
LCCSDEEKEEESKASHLVGRAWLDPALFAPTGDIYSYFQVFRFFPFFFYFWRGSSSEYYIRSTNIKKDLSIILISIAHILRIVPRRMLASNPGHAFLRQAC